MKKLLTATMVAGLLSVTVAANADGNRARDPGVNTRQQTQRARIQHGVRSGELTRRETHGVVDSQRDIRQLERGYRSDGTLTGAERRDLHHEQNEASREIYRQTHDAQDRPGAPLQTRDPGVNDRQTNQTARIVQGVKSGELTRDEAQGLRDERRDIRELEQGYKSDGALTKDERKDLHQELNGQSQTIYDEKHDDEKRN
jgi:hypothetical protein